MTTHINVNECWPAYIAETKYGTHWSLNKWLNKQGGKVVPASSHNTYLFHVEFEKDSDAVMFVLRWNIK